MGWMVLMRCGLVMLRTVLCVRRLCRLLILRMRLVVILVLLVL